MNSIRVLALPVSGAIFALAATPVQAQYMPHLDPQLYANVIMSMQGPGTCGPMSDKEIDEARLPAPGLMQDYFASAQSGTPISRHFKLNGKTAWAHGDVTVGEEALDAQKDPLALPGNRLDPETVRFFRAGTHQSAQGQWLVRDNSGDVTGVYNAVFEREARVWRLHKLEVFTAFESVAPITHYCSKPGDLDERRVEGLKMQVEGLRKRVASRTRRYERDVAKYEEAEAKLAEKPNSKSRAKKMRERRALMRQRRAKLDEAHEQLTKAIGNLFEARTELNELRSQTTQARYAVVFRDLDLNGLRKREEGEEFKDPIPTHMLDQPPSPTAAPIPESTQPPPPSPRTSGGGEGE